MSPQAAAAETTSESSNTNVPEEEEAENGREEAGRLGGDVREERVIIQHSEAKAWAEACKADSAALGHRDERSGQLE
ncbi:UNVERIFIED_CONTAM: hypothetical protein FKN15_046537 [Acipenser sinensis]